MTSTRSSSASWPLGLFPALKLLLHVLTIPGYGIFRDELYYIACSKRLALGYVDHPSLSVAVLRVVREVLGDSLWAMRLVPALVGAGVVLLVGLITRCLGGGTWAQVIAMAGALATPIFLALSHIYSMNVFDLFFWAAAVYALSRIDPAQKALGPWIVLGLILGLGLNNKMSVLWLGFGLGVGLVLTPWRRALKTAGPWVAAAISGLLFLPHVLWQVANDWPTREFIANATTEKMVRVDLAGFVRGQLDILGPGVTVLVLLGLFFLLRAPNALPDLRRMRLLGWIYLTVFVLLVLNGTSRSFYLAPTYTWLLAAGGVGFEWLVQRWSRPVRLGAGALLLTVLLGFGAVALPMVIPVLPVDEFVAYAEKLGSTPSSEERKEMGKLPQFYADMHGWTEKVAAARQAVDLLSTEERAVACLFAENYGVAGALEHLGRGGEPGGLPPVVSGHNNYWLWGPGTCTGEVLVIMGGNADELAELFESVEHVATVDCTYCMPYEDEKPVHVVRGPRVDLAESWGLIKHFD